jgi:hypothetical protein
MSGASSAIRTNWEARVLRAACKRLERDPRRNAETSLTLHLAIRVAVEL